MDTMLVYLVVFLLGIIFSGMGVLVIVTSRPRLF